METEVFRSKSLAQLAKVGVTLPATLPMIDEFAVRPLREIVDRIICLNAVAAVAHGFDKEKASAWLSQERMLENLTDDERSLFKSGASGFDRFKVQVEGMWALTWLVSIVPNLDFWRGCDPRFVTMLPSLKIAESASNFRSRARLRNEIEIGAELDLAYCLHWALRQAELNGEKPPKGLIPFVVVERRRALEWSIGHADWHKVSLDT